MYVEMHSSLSILEVMPRSSAMEPMAGAGIDEDSGDSSVMRQIESRMPRLRHVVKFLGSMGSLESRKLTCDTSAATPSNVLHRGCHIQY